MRLPEFPRLYGRAILMYIGTIVAPAGVLMWLGIQSFERQHQNYLNLAHDRLETDLIARTRSEAEKAFADLSHPICSGATAPARRL